MKSKKKVHWDSEGIRALRSHLGMTQQELADELGTRQQTISEWETGMYRPRGASATLLSIIAERADFGYRASGEDKPPRDDGFELGDRGKAL
jgi:DNA-binding transcriptional regulator YiaG